MVLWFKYLFLINLIFAIVCNTFNFLYPYPCPSSPRIESESFLFSWQCSQSYFIHFPKFFISHVLFFLQQSFIDIDCINVYFQERLEKENLRKELSRSQKEKEVILEQSKQAASQLRKFTALFLDASPKEIEKAKQKYNESR